ncbi:MAG: hypothetical protein ACLQBK_16230 [Candidatus Sulfotelmatobacter sp.]
MRITVMGALVVIAGVLLLGLILFAVGQGTNKTGKNIDERPINPS